MDLVLEVAHVFLASLSIEKLRGRLLTADHALLLQGSHFVLTL